MHETSLAYDMLEIIEGVARDNGARRVRKARAEIGELTCIDPDALTFAFEAVCRGTVAEGCALQIVKLPLTLSCPSCGFEGPAEHELLGCPACEAQGARVLSGREMRLVSIDVEDEEDA
jgi:hydrogenase nickel incorporation protein HypA/HybF